MAIVGLTRDQGFALIFEMGSTRNLLGYGIRTVRTAAFIETTRDPILTMLSIGVEKLFKLALGLISLDADATWPDRNTMQNKYRHNLIDMWDALLGELRTRSMDSTDYVKGLLAEVENDPIVPPLLEALDMYGRSGRFYYLDLLAENPQSFDNPSGYWNQIDAAALLEPGLKAKFHVASADVSNQAAWDDFHSSLHGAVADSVERLWTMIAVLGRNNVMGETGSTFGFEVHPDMVGRQ